MEPTNEHEIDEFAHQCAAYFGIAASREHEGLFCDIEKIDVPPYVAVRLELPVQATYSSEDVKDTAEGIQNLLFFSQNYLIRYTIAWAE